MLLSERLLFLLNSDDNEFFLKPPLKFQSNSPQFQPLTTPPVYRPKNTDYKPVK